MRAYIIAIYNIWICMSLCLHVSLSICLFVCDLCPVGKAITKSSRAKETETLPDLWSKHAWTEKEIKRGRWRWMEYYRDLLGPSLWLFIKPSLRATKLAGNVAVKRIRLWETLYLFSKILLHTLKKKVAKFVLWSISFLSFLEQL